MSMLPDSARAALQAALPKMQRELTAIVARGEDTRDYACVVRASSVRVVLRHALATDDHEAIHQLATMPVADGSLAVLIVEPGDLFVGSVRGLANAISE